MKYPRGIIKDVLIKADKFLFLVDFVVLDMDEDIEVSLILGWSFFTIARAIINVNDDRLVLRVGEKDVIFKIWCYEILLE